MFAHDASPPRPPFLNDSRKGTPSKSNPSSLKSFSMKGKISIISGLLAKSSPRVNTHESALKPTSDIAPPEVSNNAQVEPEKIISGSIAEHENSRLSDRKHAAKLNNDRVNQSFTIAKRLSMTFRKPPQSPQSALRVPVPSAQSRQMREAALRERGLLPPKDMSAQEREQDHKISPVSPVPQTVFTDGLSEADRIKQAWEAKVQPSDTVDPDESSDSVPSVVIQPITPENAKGSLVREDISFSSPNPAPSIRKSLSHAHLVQAKPPPTRELPPIPLEPENVPLPPSPFDQASSIYSIEAPSRNTLPCLSSSPPSSPLISNTLESLPGGIDPHIDIRSSSLSPLPPESLEISSLSPRNWVDGVLALPKLRSSSRSSVVISGCSNSDESGSVATPSLDNSSQPTSESPLSHATHNSKPISLVKTWTNEPSVPVIVESPVEEGLVIPINDIPEDEINDFLSSSKAKFGSTGKRKAFFPVRSTTADNSDRKKPVKMNRSTSLANFRYSVVSTLYRKPSSASKLKSFNPDLSDLPPSPTVPASLATQSLTPSMSTQSVKSKNSLAHVGPTSPRQALSPTIHSRGSILVETSHIEDEETRRMTEMAFMG